MTKEITLGAAQGAILGPNIWNISYVEILREEMPKVSFMVGYANDLATVITTRDVDRAQMRLNQVVRRVSSWMQKWRLDLVPHKTEIVLLTKKRIEFLRPMQVGDAEVQTKTDAKYLGVMLDSNLTFGEHMIKAADRAANIISALSRVMANSTGSWPCKRRLWSRGLGRHTAT